ncbi:MAG: hypothetical protein ACE5G1_16835, partial [bacterium]
HARAAFWELLQILQEAKYQSTSYRIDVLYQMARCESELGRTDEAKAHCQEAIALEKACDFDHELDGPYESYSEIKKELKKLARSLTADR